MSIYKHIDKKYGDGLGIQDWNNLSSAIAGSIGLGLALNSAHNVGIGTASPTSKLEVAGEIKATNLMVSNGKLGFSNHNGQRINLWGTEHAIGVQPATTYLRTSGNFAFFRGGGHNDGQLNPGTNGTAQLVILANDNVGIGTTSPSTRLEVNGEIKATQFSGDGSRLTNLSVGLTGLNLATQSGNVGIGTTSPTSKLEVNGEIKATNLTVSNGNLGFSNHNGQRINLYGTEHGIGVQGSTTYLRTSGNFAFFKGGVHNDGPLNPGTNGTVSLVINSSGNVGIGTTSPTAKLHVDSGAEAGGGLAISGDGKEGTPDGAMHFTNDCILFGGNNSGKETSSAQISAGKHVSNSLNIVGMGATGTDRKIDMWAEGGLAVRGNNNRWSAAMDKDRLYFYLDASLSGPNRIIAWDGDHWGTYSDARLKTNIEPEEQVLPRLLQLPVKRYQWIDAGGQDPQKIGFLAQDVQPLFPELVGSHTNPETQEETLTLKYANFGVLAIGGLRELKAQTDATIAEQRALIERLEERLASLEQRLN